MTTPGGGGGAGGSPNSGGSPKLAGASPKREGVHKVSNLRTLRRKKGGVAGVLLSWLVKQILGSCAERKEALPVFLRNSSFRFSQKNGKNGRRPREPGAPILRKPHGSKPSKPPITAPTFACREPHGAMRLFQRPPAFCCWCDRE